MAATDIISDADLRRQLNALGEDVGPITNTTRPFLIRKLKRLRNEQGVGKSREGKSSAKRGTSPGRRKSLPVKRSKSPSRKLIGFSSDEEDAGPSLSSTSRDLSSLRGRRKETATSNDETAERSGISATPSPTRTSGLRHRVPSFIDSLPERTLDNTGDNDAEFSDQDGKVSFKGTSRTGGITRYFERKRERVESEKSETLHAVRPSLYGRDDSATINTESNSTLGKRQNGAKNVKTSSLWSLTIKILVLISVICVTIFMLYAALKSHLSEEELLEQLVKLPVCKGGDNKVQKLDSDNKFRTCIPSLNISKLYAESLYQKLSTKAGFFECQDPRVKTRNISLDEFKEQIWKDNYSRKVTERDSILNSTLKRILEEPDRKLRLFHENNTQATSIENVTIRWIDSSVAAKPLMCRIKEAMSRLAYLSFVIGFGIGGLMVAYFIVRQRWRREEEETRKMYQFVENIIEVLREHHEASKTDKNLLPYLPIPHVRDMLIAPSDRQRLSKAWNRAVRFLSANESRIRVESQRIAGEDFEVWRWIHIATPKPRNPKLSLAGNKHGKYWQGQAFENFQSAVNPPVISPTPCLKIRNMFDPDVETDDNWHVMIQDAILEKCIENGADVVHIAVDKSSSEGCVYVKCDTHHSAGLAFRSLHGCWFDGRLVAVKYLTLKRYHQRFPVALEATERLSPSGSSPSSLVTFDPDEAAVDDINDSDVDF